MARPNVGDKVSFVNVYGDETHVGTVVDLLSVQFTVRWEVARSDGGWTERQAFVFYSDDWRLVSDVGYSPQEADIS